MNKVKKYVVMKFKIDLPENLRVRFSLHTRHLNLDEKVSLITYIKNISEALSLPEESYISDSILRLEDYISNFRSVDYGRSGICSFVVGLFSPNLLFRYWRFYSGNLKYPVIVKNSRYYKFVTDNPETKHRFPVNQYSDNYNEGKLNKGTYGEKRLSLAKFTFTMLTTIIYLTKHGKGESKK